PVLPAEVVAAIKETIAALKDGTADTEAKKSVARVLATLESRNVLVAELDSELWQAVFASLRDLRQIFSVAYAELLPAGASAGTKVLHLMVVTTRSYLAAHETSYTRYMATMPSDGSIFQWERAWPGLDDAAADLVKLREVLAGAFGPLNEFVDPEQR